MTSPIEQSKTMTSMGTLTPTGADVTQLESLQVVMCSNGRGSHHLEMKEKMLVTTSSCEGEYVILFFASQERVWIGRMLPDIRNKSEATEINMFADNPGAIETARNASIIQTKKHIDIKYQLLRKLVCTEKVKMVYCPTENMLADPMTTALERVKCQKDGLNIGVTEDEKVGSKKGTIEDKSETDDKVGS